MRVVRHSDAKSFRQSVDDFLLCDEIAHNVILGITSRIITTGISYDDVFLAHVENGSGEIVAATMRTVPYNPVLSNITDKQAIPLLVDAYADVYESLPGVLGSPEDATKFAELWQQKSGQSFTIKMEEGLYKLETVIPPRNISGEARFANHDDLEFLVEWFLDFDAETGLNELMRESAIRNIEHKLAHPTLGGLQIWCDEGRPVSLAGAGRESPSGGSVGPVYTPKAFRGRGYGSAITAAVSQEILKQGKKFCYLFTDLANPTSNKIYQDIGYKRVGSVRQIAFENRE